MAAARGEELVWCIECPTRARVAAEDALDQGEGINTSDVSEVHDRGWQEGQQDGQLVLTSLIPAGLGENTTWAGFLRPLNARIRLQCLVCTKSSLELAQ